MKIFLHVLNTWFISILIALLIAVIYINEVFQPYLVVALLYVVALGSLSFFISWGFLALIQQASWSSYEKLFLWFFVAIVSVALNIFILLLLFVREMISPETFFFFWPAFAAVIITITLRVKQFFSLINKTTHHETSMV